MPLHRITFPVRLTAIDVVHVMFRAKMRCSLVQFVPLLPEHLHLFPVLHHPTQEMLGLLFGIVGVLTGIPLSDLEVGHLLGLKLLGLLQPTDESGLLLVSSQERLPGEAQS